MLLLAVLVEGQDCLSSVQESCAVLVELIAPKVASSVLLVHLRAIGKILLPVLQINLRQSEAV